MALLLTLKVFAQRAGVCQRMTIESLGNEFGHEPRVSNDFGWRDTTEGSKLKSLDGWQFKDRENESGFDARPGGFRFGSGEF